MTLEQHYAEAERIAKIAEYLWQNPEDKWGSAIDTDDLKIREEIYDDARADAMAYLALAQVHATLALSGAPSRAQEPCEPAVPGQAAVDGPDNTGQDDSADVQHEALQATLTERDRLPATVAEDIAEPTTCDICAQAAELERAELERVTAELERAIATVAEDIAAALTGEGR